MRKGLVFVVGSLMLAIVASASVAQARRRHHHPGCGASCRQLGIAQGDGQVAGCGVQPSVNTVKVHDATSVKIPAMLVYPGTLLVAAINTQGAPVTPPMGWTAVPNTDVAGAAGERLQIFYRVPVPANAPLGTVPPATFTFTSATAETMTAAVMNFDDVSETAPVEAAAGAANPTPSTGVTAPSITATTANALLVYIGASQAAETWRAPAGMQLQQLMLGQGANPPVTIGVATQRWPAAGATGARTASISGASAGVGELLALNYPAPVTCPHVRDLNPTGTFTSMGFRKKAYVLKANAQGIIPVRLQCQWSAECVGVFAGFDDDLRKLVASDIAIPAGQTRTVQVATTAQGQKELRAHRQIQLELELIAKMANGQLTAAATNQPNQYSGELVLR